MAQKTEANMLPVLKHDPAMYEADVA